MITQELDVPKLCRAIAVAETSNCTKGTALTHSNCFGIKENGKFVHFSSKAQSFKSCEWNWKKHYKVFPTIVEARKWDGNTRSEDWLRIVTEKYNE